MELEPSKIVVELIEKGFILPTSRERRGWTGA
jgi:hypothetical protein